MKRLAIITGPTLGLRRDADVLSRALDGRVACTTLALSVANGFGRWSRLRRRVDPWTTQARQTPLVFMERLYGNWMRTSRKSVWVPNLEWVDAQSAALMSACAAVWCKTRQSERVIGERGGRPSFIGFSSEDRQRGAVAKDFDSFLHVAGRSHLKGTAAVVAAWRANPQWPQLTVVAQASAFEPVAAPNIRYCVEPLGEDALNELMNACGVHLCTSEAEGFGHYIVEALSTGALTITSDAPPMNEHLSRDEGFLVDAPPAGTLKWGMRYAASAAGIAVAVNAVLGMSAADKAAMSRRARERYLASRSEFETRVRDAAARL